jgi:hypothetical protein
VELKMNIINKTYEDMIEKIELLNRKINILEDLINEARLNIENKKVIEIEQKNNLNIKCNNKTKKVIINITKKRTKKKQRLPFNNYVMDTSSDDTSSD